MESLHESSKKERSIMARVLFDKNKDFRVQFVNRLEYRIESSSAFFDHAMELENAVHRNNFVFRSFDVRFSKLLLTTVNSKLRFKLFAKSSSSSPMIWNRSTQSPTAVILSLLGSWCVLALWARLWISARHCSPCARPRVIPRRGVKPSFFSDIPTSIMFIIIGSGGGCGGCSAIKPTAPSG
ncbi:hypothetical protein G4B88_025285 [Cannabis sativa]|uniref:Uncharacterized protein n=1 Tax=Cannabis sativa TaxID=3483 RepID=A0A7J6DSC6_CANSA|nr:hypothetical protein G4B88_025285 [Cannabis sativa]